MNRKNITAGVLMTVAALCLVAVVARAADVSAPESSGSTGPGSAAPASTSETVKASQVTGLTLNPPQATVKIGGTLSFKAVATFEDGSQQDVTGEAAWAPASKFTGAREGVFYLAAMYQGRKAVATIRVEGGKKTQTEPPAPAADRKPPEVNTAQPPAPATGKGTDFGQQFGDRERQRREERGRREGVDSAGSFSGTGPGQGRPTAEDLKRQAEERGFPMGSAPYGSKPAGGGQNPKAPGQPPGTGDESLRYYLVQKTAAGTWRWPNYQCTLTTYEVLSAGEKEFPALFSETRRRFDQDNQYCREKGCDGSGPGTGASRDWRPQKWSVSYQGPLSQYPQTLPEDRRNCTGEMR
jgi:hypothetical protein